MGLPHHAACECTCFARGEFLGDQAPHAAGITKNTNAYHIQSFGGCDRNVAPSRLRAFMLQIRYVRSTISFSVKCTCIPSYSVSDTGALASKVTASAQARAAFSFAVNSEDSSHAFS